MDTTIKTSLVIQKTLLDQADLLAQRLDLSQSRLIELALEAFIKQHNQANERSSRDDAKSVNQGDVYWLQLDDTDTGEPGIPHPHIVVQDNLLNHSRLSTTVVCALTSNIKRVALPGNLLLEVGEANLPRQSVVEVSKLSSVDKTQLGAYIGTLSDARVHQILAGMRFLQASFF